MTQTVRESRLPNGLRVVTDDMPHVETVSVGLWVGAGARNESAAVNGISHMLEHMAFKGTKRRNARSIAEEIEAVGGHLNAYTSREQTAYYARVLKEDVALAVDILADILQYSTFEEEELKRERGVIVQEIGQTEDTPDDLVFEKFQETAYRDQSLGRSILGTVERVNALGRDDLFAYMKSHYVASQMVLAAAGRIDHDALVALAGEKFGELPTAPSLTWQQGKYTAGDCRAARDLEQVHIVAGFDGLPHDDPNFYTAFVLSTLLGGGMSSRLFQEVREKRGLCYSVSTFTASYRDGGLFGVYAGTGENQVAELVAVMAAEIMSVAAKVGSDEVARARAQLKAGMLMSLESSSSRCERLGRQLLIFDRPIPTEEVIAKVDAVDEASVARIAERLFTGSRPVVAALGPVEQLEGYDKIAARFG
ncbi:MAG: insulinase family protein [Alphaproteobacteria bacterium]|nr:insulinase family protein [Alphaproteobacteria bacterium]